MVPFVGLLKGFFAGFNNVFSRSPQPPLRATRINQENPSGKRIQGFGVRGLNP